MYNDYYLQQIDSKLNINNNKLDDIINNQEDIILNQHAIISGDIMFYNSYTHNSNLFYIGLLCIAFSVLLIFSAELVEHYLGLK